MLPLLVDLIAECLDVDLFELLLATDLLDALVLGAAISLVSSPMV